MFRPSRSWRVPRRLLILESNEAESPRSADFTVIDDLKKIKPHRFIKSNSKSIDLLFWSKEEDERTVSGDQLRPLEWFWESNRNDSEDDDLTDLRFDDVTELSKGIPRDRSSVARASPLTKHLKFWTQLRPLKRERGRNVTERKRQREAWLIDGVWDRYRVGVWE